MNKDIGNHSQLSAKSIHKPRPSHECGYCKGKKPNGSQTWGFVSSKTRVDDYEILMSRGWRRCGTYYYKQNLPISCCKQYTIRLNVDEFKISKKQTKALKKFNSFLNGELEHKIGKKIEEAKKPQEEKKKTQREELEAKLSGIVLKGILIFLTQTSGLFKELSFAEIRKKIKTKQTRYPEHGDFYTNVALILFNFNKAKGGTEPNVKEIQEKIISCISKDVESLQFSIKMAENGLINFKACFDLCPLEKKKAVKKVVKEKKSTEGKTVEEHPKEEKKTKLQYQNYFDEFIPNPNPNPKHKYTIEIVPAVFSIESFEIFKIYQADVHHDYDMSISGYTGFLCDSPLYDPNNPADAAREWPIKDSSRKLINQGVWPQYHGSYHMCHRIDGKLVAVGVLDITPHVVSSVYFMYDTKYKFLNMGIVGALREIEYIRHIHRTVSPSLQYYYMGFFISDCQKMVYKKEYEPSELVCPETYTWVSLEKVLPKIAKGEQDNK